jgi:nucleoside-diphosphate-sugar epimerase
VTGGAGFIGSHLAGELLDLGADVAIIDDLSASDGQYLWYLIDTYPARVKFCFASILEPNALAEASRDCDVVFHLAAMNSVPRSLEDPERCMAVNTMGTLRVCSAAQHAGVRRVVFAASSSAYGEDPALPKVETMLPAPIAPYAVSKLAGESIVTAWQHSYGLEGVVLRYFNVFGSRQPANSPYAGVVASFAHRLLAGERPVVFGDGSQSRDFTHVANAVHATLLAGVADRDACGEVINVGCGEKTTILELARMLSQVAGRKDLEPIFHPERKGDVPHSMAQITKAKALLGYEPIRNLEDGLAETVAWVSRQAMKTEDDSLDPEDSRTAAEPVH